MAKNSILVVCAADSLENVPRGTFSDNFFNEIRIESCRNEFTSAQLVVRALRLVPALQVTAPTLTHTSGARGVEVTARFVGYIPLSHNTENTPPEELTCVAPALCPDPLLADETIDVAEDTTQPVWLTVFVPPDAPAGEWKGTVSIRAAGEVVELPMVVLVHPITLPSKRNLWISNWMDRRNLARFHGTEQYTPRYWEVAANYARNMAAHRQNVTKVSLHSIDITQQPDDSLIFDYTNFDQWIETFTRAGCMELIEGDALGRWGDGKFESTWLEWDKFRARKKDGTEVLLDPERAIEKLLPDLSIHLKQRGWFERFIMHVVDEPAPHTEEDYRKMVSLVRRAAPGVRIIEAMSCTDPRGYLDIWVPCLHEFDERLEQYLNMREQSGFEMWFYTCCFPTGCYPNRFLDYSLLKTRILHWINWRYKLSGYLHWGLNYWADDPFQKDRLFDDVPAGDCWIIYPGKDGPLDSLRWEQMREGIQDYELLHLLEQRSKEVGRGEGEADRICAELVTNPLTYARDWQSLRTSRRKIIEALLAVSSEEQ